METVDLSQEDLDTLRTSARENSSGSMAAIQPLKSSFEGQEEDNQIVTNIPGGEEKLETPPPKKKSRSLAEHAE